MVCESKIVQYHHFPAVQLKNTHAFNHFFFHWILHLLSEDAYWEGRECFREGASMTQTRWRDTIGSEQETVSRCSVTEKLSRFCLLRRLISVVKTSLESSQDVFILIGWKAATSVAKYIHGQL